ncbi:MAG: hypothetical protein M3308_01000, partial [Actinomycetota bacterium]|nr:hypothetical protein [Actinomycetota bacterium]
VGWTAEGSRIAGAGDPDAWEATATEWENLRRPHRVAYAWWRCAEAHLAQHGRPADAVRPLQAAALAAQSIAPLLAAICRLARRLLADRLGLTMGLAEVVARRGE